MLVYQRVILWLCEFTTWRRNRGEFSVGRLLGLPRHTIIQPPAAEPVSYSDWALPFKQAMKQQKQQVLTGTVHSNFENLCQICFKNKLLEVQVVLFETCVYRILYTVAIMRCFVIFFQKALWINPAFRFFEFLFGVPSWWEKMRLTSWYGKYSNTRYKSWPVFLVFLFAIPTALFLFVINRFRWFLFR